MQQIQVVSVQVDADAGTAHGSHHGAHVRGAGYRHFALQIGAGICNPTGQFADRNGYIFPQQNIHADIGHIFAACANPKHAAGAAGKHSADSFHFIHGADPFDDIVRYLGCLLQSSVLRHLQFQADLSAVHAWHEGKSAA